MLALLFFVASPLMFTEKPGEAAKKDLDALQGTWEMAELEVNGKPVEAKRLKGTTLLIKEDQYLVKARGQEFKVTLKLDPSQKPRAVDMVFTDETDGPQVGKAIYEFVDKDTFRLCRYQPTGKDRPKEFNSKRDEDLFIVTWKRIKE